MAVYEANLRSLAEFISDTKLGFLPSRVTSTEGCRIDQKDSSYLISADDILCDRIYVVSDCFINSDGTISVTSYIPGTSYFLRTNELSHCYSKGDHLSFQYEFESQTVKHTFSNIKLQNREDFEKYLQEVINTIKQTLNNKINEFKGKKWTICSVKCDIEWQIDRIKI